MNEDINGITVDGESLEEYLFKRDDDEKRKQAAQRVIKI